MVFCVGVYMLLKRRPPVAAGVVVFGCTALVAVTLYSHNLFSDANDLMERAHDDPIWKQPEYGLFEREENAHPREYFPPLKYSTGPSPQVAHEPQPSEVAPLATE
jgi:hypothetical protein